MYSLLNAESRSDHNLRFYLTRESLYKVSAGTAKWPSTKSQVGHTDSCCVQGGYRLYSGCWNIKVKGENDDSGSSNGNGK